LLTRAASSGSARPISRSREASPLPRLGRGRHDAARQPGVDTERSCLGCGSASSFQPLSSCGSWRCSRRCSDRRNRPNAALAWRRDAGRASTAPGCPVRVPSYEESGAPGAEPVAVNEPGWEGLIMTS
jgi:hypothetical protein